MLHDIGLDRITPDEIDRPTAAKTLPTYAWFLEQITQLTLEDVMMTAQLQLDSMADSVSILRLLTLNLATNKFALCAFQELYREAVLCGSFWAIL